jgi:putative endonuclease
MKRGGAVYIMTNKTHSTLYTGVTSDLMKRVYEHKNNIFPDSFMAKYKTYKLIYFDGFHRIEDAIAREKRIKAGSRKMKIELINSINPDWRDLYDDVLYGRDCFVPHSDEQR